MARKLEDISANKKALTEEEKSAIKAYKNGAFATVQITNIEFQSHQR